ncbi:hypothetical protein [Corynebacterium minutissimum]|uniref:hypothetical protein n=1 Tax=Corynebacterium minutissimum TaxID=38301 RepID=UPI001EF354A1|nr:hypothetical protein [Corynebacterium minutissimum]MCG7230025.1 hypothetical protein [Corynebacterium minutissimum]MCG7239099.1 hypothetical protein [Corynebacterium minutissimum]
MSNFSRGLLAATLTSSLAFAGATAASAEETSNSCGSPKAEFTASVEGKEHTFKKASEFLWQATDDENVTLNRAEVFEMAKEGADVCDSEPIDTGDWGNGDGSDDDNTDPEDGGETDGDETDGDDAGSDDDETDGDDAGSDDDETDGDDADGDNETDGDDADSDDEGNEEDVDSEDGNDDDADSENDKDDKNKGKKSSLEDALSSEDGKPSGLGIAAIVISVLGALAAAAPHAARALGIKLPF